MARSGRWRYGWRSGTKGQCRNESQRERRGKRMALNEEEKEKLRTRTVEFLLCLRAQYLAGGANALRHYDQIQNRMLAAARQSATAEEWTTAMMRGLQLPAPNSSTCSAILDLSNAVRDVGEQGCEEWFGLLEREYGLLMALVRKCAEERKAKRESEGK